jgi:hypothetical protein
MMTKKDEKKDEHVLDALLPDIEAMSPEETDALIAESGVDMRALRARLQEAAKGIASDLRKGGTAAPRYLTRAIEALDDSEKLPTTTDEAALSKANDVIRRFRTPQPIPKDVRLLKAARFSPSATADDRAAEQLANDLKKELDEDDPPTK